VGLLTYGSRGDVSHPTRQSVLQLVHPEDRERIRKVAKDSIASSENRGEVEYRIRYRDGSIRWMHDKWIVVRDGAGGAVAIEGVVRDNTERKKAEEALRESRERYRQLVETMNDGLVVADEHDVLSYVNDSFCRMLGFSSGDLIGRPVIQLVDSAGGTTLKEQTLRRSKGERTPYEIGWIDSEGRGIQTIVSPEPIFDDEGNFCGGFAVVTDISEQKRVQHALEERERELEAKNLSLEDLISALNVLLKKREEDRLELQRTVLNGVKEFVDPYLDNLKKSELNQEQSVLIDIIEANLSEITTPCSGESLEKYENLTASESRVARLVKIGKSSKEIANVLRLSTRTVESHRYSIRKKLGILHNGQQLRARLLAASEEMLPETQWRDGAPLSPPR